MNRTALIITVFVTILNVLCSSLFYVVGRSEATKELQQDALKQGVATYVCDQNTGTCKFAYIPRERTR